MSDFTSPEELYTDDQLARYYAVQAARAMIRGTDDAAALARWIIEGDHTDT